MTEQKNQVKKEVVLQEGYQPKKKGYTSPQGDLDTSNPPKGGSGVPASSSTDREGETKKD